MATLQERRNNVHRKITALIPTFYRPDGLARVLASLKDTAPSVKCVIAAEADDIRALEIARTYGATAAQCEQPLQGCAYAWNTALKASPNDDIYVIGADDAIFKFGWLEESLKALDKLGGSGLVAFKSGHRRKFGDHYMMTRDFIVKHHGGVAAVPHYRSWCVDDEAQWRAKKAGKFIKCNEAVVIHDKGTEDDKGYIMGQSYRELSRAIYYKRHASGFPDDFEAIIK